MHAVCDITAKFYHNILEKYLFTDSSSGSSSLEICILEDEAQVRDRIIFALRPGLG